MRAVMVLKDDIKKALKKEAERESKEAGKKYGGGHPKEVITESDITSWDKDKGLAIPDSGKASFNTETEMMNLAGMKEG